MNMLIPTLQHKDLLTLRDYTSNEILELIEFAAELKKPENKHLPLLQGKVLGMIFEKSSTRTRVSFEAGMLQLGGHAMYLSTRDIQMGRGETIADTARVLSGYLDGIMIRTFAQSTVQELAENSSIPVINGLTDDYHPCQTLADLLTVYETFGSFKHKKMAYIGDGNNVAHSLMIGAAKTGMHFTLACPAGYEPDAEILAYAQAEGAKTGAEILVTHDPVQAATGAHVIYTDVWASMGQEDEQAERLKAFEGFQVNEQLTSHAEADYIFMHCLPAHREEEVSTAVLEGPHSVVFQEAENRLHAQKALLVALMGK
ncbi:ornithine carbamoyltransferase [Jeotgalibacillus haloalkalitolerans]|uniref:Ornithine carbamoyltransferase n=1 Tax=Jeotgalibacillus haloalkalitolerans TaxID=3104292 RepID=A0ABU5KIQ6_9BACL|nr:ornithine carbamoyltransferase [Jeotgalibacillus sp. HH7-29]MDZ5711077.1 ornithine carbamoyltransferase [Jeotgalibacillus sp. HH7-29]